MITVYSVDTGMDFFAPHSNECVHNSIYTGEYLAKGTPERVTICVNCKLLILTEMPPTDLQRAQFAKSVEERSRRYSEAHIT